MFANHTHPYLSLARVLTLSFLILIGIAASARAQTNVYELRQDNTIWRYPGDECSDPPCWTQIDNDKSPKTISAGYGGYLWQLRKNDGTIWLSRGAKCDASGCHWDLVDTDTLATTIAAGFDVQLYKLQSDGSIWLYMNPAQPSNPPATSGPVWKPIGKYPNVEAMAAFGLGLYLMNKDAGIRMYSIDPNTLMGEWKLIDNKPTIKQIACTGAGLLYEARDDGSIWQYTGAPCNQNGTCPGWTVRLIRNAANMSIAAFSSHLYYLSTNGSIYREPCLTAAGESCSGWQTISNAKSQAIVTGTPHSLTAGPGLYRLDSDGTVWSFNGKPCESASCNGWQQIDKGDPKNPVKTLVAN